MGEPSEPSLDLVPGWDIELGLGGWRLHRNIVEQVCVLRWWRDSALADKRMYLRGLNTHTSIKNGAYIICFSALVYGHISPIWHTSVWRIIGICLMMNEWCTSIWNHTVHLGTESTNIWGFLEFFPNIHSQVGWRKWKSGNCCIARRISLAQTNAQGRR